MAMTGIRLTFVCSRRINSISRGFRLRGTSVTGTYDAPMKMYSRMTSRLDEVQACMDAIVHDFLSVDAVFLFQIRVETGFNVLDNRFPARMEYVRVRREMISEKKVDLPVIIVDKVTETGGVDDSKAKTNTILLNV